VQGWDAHSYVCIMKPVAFGAGILLICLLCLFGCKPKQKPLLGRFYTGNLFGKPYEIDAVGDSADYTTQIDSIIRVFQSCFDLMDPESILSQYNAFSRTDTVFVFQDSTRAFGLVYDLARDLNRNTLQYFDPTIGPLKREWIVANSRGDLEPNLDSLYAFVGFDGAKMDLNELNDAQYQYIESQMRKADARVEADFTNLAAAFALDQIGDFLKRQGIIQFRIRYGREVITFGNAVDSLNIVAIGLGNESADQQISLINAAFSSKNSRDKLALIDPTYGYPADNEMAFVAVSAPSLAEAEVFSDAFMLMGLEKISSYYSLNDRTKIESFMFYLDGDTLRKASTNGFDAMIIPTDSLNIVNEPE
jgi:thiamine biosynthesis lipoprotein ApbE